MESYKDRIKRRFSPTEANAVARVLPKKSNETSSAIFLSNEMLVLGGLEVAQDIIRWPSKRGQKSARPSELGIEFL